MDNYIDDHCYAQINLDALCHNVKHIQNSLEKTELCAVIKADAYGHGAVMIAKTLQEQNIEHFAVSSLAEALELRNNNIKQNIYVLGYTDTRCAKKLAKHNLIQCCFSPEYAKELSHTALLQDVNVRVHLKIDTGMGRIGFTARQNFDVCIGELLTCYSLPNLQIEGVFQHFAVADSISTDDKAYTLQQTTIFLRIINELSKRGHTPKCAHMSNSAAALLKLDKQLNLQNIKTFARVGIALYGLAPSEDLTFDFLKPVMALKTKISMVKTLHEGESVSYGRNFTAIKPTNIATLCAGYADGYPRALSKGVGTAEVSGKCAKVLGNVCMDQTIIDVSQIPNIKAGDEVILWGGTLSDSAEDIAKKTNTIGYEIVCGVAHRVPRIYIKQGEETHRIDYLANNNI